MAFKREKSPLIFEPFSPSSSDIVLEDPESDIDETSRVAKRRRIERLGEEVLAGETLYIMTAALKGPFEANWENPWKKNALEVPETIQRRRPNAPQKTVEPTGVGNASSPALPTTAVGFCGEAIFRPADTNQSQPWLKRADAYLSQRPQSSPPTSSPTPAPRQRREVEDALPLNIPSKCSRDGPSPSRSGDAKTAPIPLVHKEDPAVPFPLPPAPPSDSAAQTGGAHLGLCKRRRGSNDPGTTSENQARKPKRQAEGDQRPVSDKAIGDLMRREVQALDYQLPSKSSRKSCVIVPSSSNLPTFKFRRSKTRVKPDSTQVSENASSISENVAVKTKPTKRVSFPSSPSPTASSKVKENNSKGVSTNYKFGEPVKHDVNNGTTSTVSTTGVPGESGTTTTSTGLPSAQIKPEDLIQPPAPNISMEPLTTESGPTSTGEPTAENEGEEDSMLQISTQAALTRAQGEFLADLITPAKPMEQAGSAHDHGLHKADINASTSQKATKTPATGEQASTQAMLSAITPFTFSTAKRIKPNSSRPSNSDKQVGRSKFRESFNLWSPTRTRSPTALPVVDLEPASNPLPFIPRDLDMSTSPGPEPEPGHDPERERHPRTSTTHAPVSDVHSHSHSSSSRYESAKTTHSLPQLPPPPRPLQPEPSSHHSYQNSIKTNHTANSASLSSFPISATAATTATTTTGTTTHQDAQPREDQPEPPNVDLNLDVDALFDLEQSLSDLGSFLQSWDVEKEVRMGSVQ